MYGSQTPIDIHCAKLVDWLVQRRHCRKDWGENLATIRRKIRAAIGDMPENEEIKQLLIGSKLDYFKSKKIVDILKTTEASSKNIFGYYSSQRMKDWQFVVNSYERDYVFLAELSTDLIRETTYEVPGIRKLVVKLNKEKDELEKERANLLRRAHQFNSEYQKMAQSYEIEGVNVVAELAEKSNSLSGVMDGVINITKNLKPSLNYYRQFASSTTKQDSTKFLPILGHIVDNGNSTVYEWKHGYAPERIEAPEKSASIASGGDGIEIVDDEIDFGDEIDFTSSESSSGFVHVDKQSENGNRNMEEIFTNVEEPDLPGTIASPDHDGKVARGDDAKLLLEFRKTRNQFLNNLHELEAFYHQITSETSSNTDKNSSFSIEATRTRQFNKNEIEKMLSDIKQIIGTMNQEKNKILFQMNDSPSFLEAVKDKFSTKKKQISDCNIKAELLVDRIKDLENQVRETEVHLKNSISSAKGLQEKVESSLRDLYKGRSINIMGCVN